MRHQRSMHSDSSQVADGVTTFDNNIKPVNYGINVPKLGTNSNMVALDKSGDHMSEEENLTDDAITEIDPERQRINSVSRAASPTNFNQPHSPRDMR